MPDIDLETILLQKEQAKLKIAEAELAMRKIRYDRIFSESSLVAICFSLLILCITGVSCYGCHRTTDIDSVLAQHGYKKVTLQGGQTQIVPLEKQ